MGIYSTSSKVECVVLLRIKTALVGRACVACRKIGKVIVSEKIVFDCRRIRTRLLGGKAIFLISIPFQHHVVPPMCSRPVALRIRHHLDVSAC